MREPLQVPGHVTGEGAMGEPLRVPQHVTKEAAMREPLRVPQHVTGGGGDGGNPYKCLDM